MDDIYQFGYTSKLDIYIYIGWSPDDKWEKENLKKRVRNHPILYIQDICACFDIWKYGIFQFYLITCDMVVALDVHGNLWGGKIDWNDPYFECN